MAATHEDRDAIFEGRTISAMKWFWICLIGLAALLAAMLLINRPKDELVDLRPFITSEEDAYEQRYGLHGEQDYFFVRSMDVRDLRNSKAQAILKNDNIAGEQCGIWYYDVRIVSPICTRQQDSGLCRSQNQIREATQSRRSRIYTACAFRS